MSETVAAEPARLECWVTNGETVCMECAVAFTGAVPTALLPPRTCARCKKNIADLWPANAPGDGKTLSNMDAPTPDDLVPILPALPEAAPEEYPKSLGLRRAMLAYNALVRGRPREFGFHPSELAGLCPVLHYYVAEAYDNLTADDPAKVREAFAFLRAWVDSKKGSPELEVEFELGELIHELVRGRLGASGFLVGSWECGWCDAFIPGPVQMPRTHAPDVQGRPMLVPAPCRVCSGRNLRLKRPWSYIEPALNEVAAPGRKIPGTLGHIDGNLATIHKGKLCRFVLEIKSAKESDYKEKTAVLPMPRHIFQASIYAWVAGVPFICFVYVNKNQANEWKEFLVPVDLSAIATVRGKIEAVNHGLSTKAAPLHARACKDVREEQARKCVAVERCFGCRPPAKFWS